MTHAADDPAVVHCADHGRSAHGAIGTAQRPDDLQRVAPVRTAAVYERAAIRYERHDSQRQDRLAPWHKTARVSTATC